MYLILYVDDEPDLLELAKLFLETSQEFSVDTKESAIEGLQAIKERHYDAIISDFQMPGMDGIAFLKEIRTNFGNIPFVIFTGRGREEIVIEALNYGADFYLQKGGDAQALYTELMHVIRRTIRMRRAEVSLAEQEQRYHDLQNATDLIQSVAPDGHFLFVNKKWQDTLGYNERDLVHLNLFDIIDNESKKHCQELFPRVIAGENVGIIEVVFKTRDGKKVYAEGLSSCKITDGKPQYTRGIFKDVSDRRKATDELHAAYERVTAAEEELRANYEMLSEKEHALRESEEKYRTLVEYTLDAILILDLTGKILFANQAAGRLIGSENYRDIIGVKNVLEFIAPESQGDAIRDFGKVAQGIDGYLAQYKVITMQQQERWVESIGKRIIFDGTPAIHISVRDITDRHNAESVIQESERKFRTIFENSPYPITVNSMPDGRFIEVNKAFVLASGYTEAEVIGKNPMEVGLLPLLDFGKLASRLLLEGRLENVPMALVGKGGKKVHVLFSVIPCTIKDQPAIMTVTAEVTQLKRVEEELLKMNEDLNAAYEELTATEEELRANYEELSGQEQALRESEEKFRALVEYSLDGILITDFTGTLLFANQTAGRLVDIEEYKALIGKKNVLEFISPECQPQVLRDFSNVMQGNDAYLVSYKLITATKREVWVECIGKKIMFGGSPAMLVSLRDVTARMRTEAVLKESEARFRTLFEMSPDGIILFDLAGRVTFASPEAMKIFHVSSQDEAVGTSVFDWADPEYHEQIREAMVQLLDGKIRHETVYRVRRRDGSSFFAETGQGIFTDANGRADGFMVIIRDISERKQAEEKLRESENKFATVFRSSPVTLTLVSAADGTFVDVNDAFLKNTGYSREDVIGRTSEEVGIFIDPNERKRLELSVRDQRRVFGMEIQCRMKNGEIRTCMFNSGIIVMDGKPHILSTVEDISLRKAAESAFQAMVRSMVGTTGLDSLNKITENVSSWLEADCVMIGEIQPDRQTVKVLSMLLDGNYVPDFFYKLKDTPCENASEKGFCLYQDNVRDFFPKAKDLVDLNIRGYAGTALRNSEGSVMGILCVLSRRPIKSVPAMREIMDVIATKASAEIERTQIEHTLRQSEERFRMLLQHVPSVAVQGYSMDGTTQYWNDASERLYGYTAEEAIGKNLVEIIIPPEMRDDVRNAIQYMAESGQPIPSSELSLMRKDGSRVAVFSSHAVVKRSGGALELFCIDIDLTERKQVEEALRESEEKFRTLVEHSLDGILIVDMTGKILFRNRAAAQVVGTENQPDGDRAKSVMDFIAPESRASVLKDLSQVAQGTEAYPVSYQVISSTGKKIWVEGIGKRIIFQNNPAIIVSLRDISARKRMEEAILRTNTQLSLLSSITRHDIINKISVIKGHIAISRNRGPDQDYTALLNKLESTTDNIQSQIEFTRLYQALGTKMPEWQKPGMFVAAEHLPETVTIRNELGDLEIYADLMLEKVFHNLADNSVRHGGNVTEIRIHFQKDPDGLTILFEDNGIGIPATEKEKIFKRGYGKNTGLGLFLAREILAITGMTIRETGEAGKGARFEIHVPDNAYRESQS